MADVQVALASMNKTLDTMMGMLQKITQKMDTTENTLQSIVQRVVVLEAHIVAPSVPSSPIAPVRENSAVLSVLPDSPVADSALVPSAPPAVAPLAVPPLPTGIPEVCVQVPVFTNVSTPVSMTSLMARLSAVADRQAAAPCVELAKEDGGIAIFDPGISYMNDDRDADLHDSTLPLLAKSRQSLYMVEQDRAEKCAKVVQYTRAAPPIDHIKLTRLTPRKVLQFWVAVLEYQSSHLLKLNVASLISQTVKDAIVARFPELLHDRFNHLKDIQLQHYTIKMIQPRTKAEFTTKMTAAVRFNDDATLLPRAEHFGLFYAALLSYKVHFTRMYDILSRDNPHAVPECTMHKGGLIRLFLSKIPHGYGISVHNCMSVKKYDDIEHYLAAFYDVVRRHHQYHLTTTELNDCFTVTTTAAAKPARCMDPVEHVNVNARVLTHSRHDVVSRAELTPAQCVVTRPYTGPYSGLDTN